MDKDLEVSIKIAERSPYRLSLKVIVSGSAMSQGELDVSYRLLMECLTFLPGYLPAQRLISVNRVLARDNEAALQEFNHLLSLNPSSEIGMFGSSILLIESGRGQLARENLLELTEHGIFGETAKKLLHTIDNDEGLSDSNYKKQASVLIREHEKTAHDMLKELGNGSENIRLKLVLAELLLDRGEKKTAMGILRRLKDSHPNYPDLLSILAKLTGNENSEKASFIYQTILDIQPTYPLSDEVMSSLDLRYGNMDDIPAISELDTWCETVLVQYANQHVIPGYVPPKTPKKVEPIEQLKVETEEIPVNSDPVVFVSDPTEETQEEAREIVAETKEEPKKEVELDLNSVDSHQLQRARTILEQARKILDQTKNAPAKETPTKEPEKIKQTEKESIIPEQIKPQIEEIKQVEEVVMPDTSVPTQPETKEEIFYDEEETFFDENIPQRIVLPTSETENEYSEESAWNLLKEGQAEEAFFMFSKLIQKMTGSDD